MEQFEIKRLIPIDIGGLDLSFTNSALFMLIAVALATLFLTYSMRTRALVPGRLQSMAELSYEFIANMIRENVGTEGRRYFPFIFTLFMFILFGNLLGMMPYSFTYTSHIIVTFALAELLVAGGERVGIPGLMNPSSSRNVIDKMAEAMLHDDAARPSLPPSFVPSALAEIVVLSDFWSPMPDIRKMLAGLSGSGAHGTLIQVVDPAEETFPYSGRVEFAEPESGELITAGRAESWAKDYVARVALHRDEIRAETNKLDWLFSTHTTTRSAAELLLFLHAGMMVSKGGIRSTVKAGRSA